MSSRAYDAGYPSTGSSYSTHKTLAISGSCLSGVCRDAVAWPILQQDSRRRLGPPESGVSPGRKLPWTALILLGWWEFSTSAQCHTDHCAEPVRVLYRTVSVAVAL